MSTFEGTGIKNLKLRGGMYYWRQRIRGIQYSESLQTGDREEALRRMAEKVDAVKNGKGLKEKKMTTTEASSSESVDKSAGWVTFDPNLKIVDCTVRDGGLCNAHKFAAVYGIYITKRRHPFTLCQPGFFDVLTLRKGRAQG